MREEVKVVDHLAHNTTRDDVPLLRHGNRYIGSQRVKLGLF